MADIAFLLLIFFMISTKIEVVKGINQKLPSIEAKSVSKNNTKVINVLVDRFDRLLVNHKQMAINELRNTLIEEITANKGKEIVVSIHNDKSTSYAAYVEVYDQIKGAFVRQWNAIAEFDYNKPFEDLNVEEKKAVIAQLPLSISEAEPFEL